MAILYGQAVCRFVFEKRGLGQTLSQHAHLHLQPRLGLGARPSGSIPHRSSSVRLENELAFHQRGTRSSMSTNISGASSVSALVGRSGRSRQNGKNQIRKIRNSKISKSQKTKSLNSPQFSLRDRSRNSFSQDRVLVLKISGKTTASSLLVLHLQCAMCILNASKQCPYEATNLRGNIEPSEYRMRHGGGDWEAEGRVGVDSVSGAIC